MNTINIKGKNLKKRYNAISHSALGYQSLLVRMLAGTDSKLNSLQLSGLIKVFGLSLCAVFF